MTAVRKCFFFFVKNNNVTHFIDDDVASAVDPPVRIMRVEI